MTDLPPPIAPFDHSENAPPGGIPIPEVPKAGDLVWVPGEILHVNLDGSVCVLEPYAGLDGIDLQKVDRVPSFSLVPRKED